MYDRLHENRNRLCSAPLCPNDRGLYRVGQAIDFTEEEEVLNRWIENRLCFHRRGDVANGWLVASGLNEIPGIYRDGMITKLNLTFTISSATNTLQMRRLPFREAPAEEIPSLESGSLRGCLRPGILRARTGFLKCLKAS